MKKPRVSIISAVAEKNRGIGKDNKLLVNLPEDLAHFKRVTMGHPVIMGLNTYKSLPFLLPGRLNIVLFPDEMQIEGAVVAHNLEEAIAKAAEADNEEVFVIGGAYVYKQAMALADRLYLTLFDGDFEADVFFPDYSDFSKVISQEGGESNGHKLTFLTLERP